MLPERSDRTIYLRVLGPLLLATLTLVLVSVGGFHALSAARAYVGGESLWSKARSETTVRLRARANGSAMPCAPMADWLAVPLGDRIARLALEQDPPDIAAARAGFLRGGNLPDDIGGMIDLYRRVGHLPLLREPIEAWREGDRLIGQLSLLGERICAAPPGSAAVGEVASNLQALERLDAGLIQAEKKFSASLGESSRLTAQLLTLTILLLALLLAGGSTWFVTRSLRAQIAQRSALEQANTRWELAADAAGIGVFVWRTDDDTLQLDRRARLLYGLDPDSTLTVRRSELRQQMHPEDRGDFEQLTDAALKRDAPLRTRYRLLGADGSVRHVEALGTVHSAAAEAEPRQMFGVLRDVTDEEAAARLRIERDAAERTAQGRSEFLSRLSHELRTPLNAVLGLAQLLDIDTAEPLSPQQRKRMRLILDSGWHLLHLVDDVLDITRIDTGQLAVRCVPTDPRVVLHTSLGLIEPERLRRGVEIVDQWPAAPPRLLADAQRLQQVFVNLLSNACKYNRPGGRLVLGHRETADHVCLSIGDEGLGFDPAQLDELFQPFKRLPQTAEEPGVGLGLVVVKLLVEQMHGHIEVASEAGHGSTFTVCLRKA